MPEKKLKMCPDPQCNKESPEDAETCIGCGLEFGVFDMFDRVLEVRERRKAAEANKAKGQGKSSMADGLRKLVRK